MKRVALPWQRAAEDGVALEAKQETVAVHPVAAARVQAPGLVDVRGLAAFLQVSPRTAERLVAQGAPCFEFGRHHPKRRKKCLRRFDCEEVLAWLRQRRDGNGGGDGR